MSESAPRVHFTSCCELLLLLASHIINGHSNMWFKCARQWTQSKVCQKCSNLFGNLECKNPRCRCFGHSHNNFMTRSTNGCQQAQVAPSVRKERVPTTPFCSTPCSPKGQCIRRPKDSQRSVGSYAQETTGIKIGGVLMWTTQDLPSIGWDYQCIESWY